MHYEEITSTEDIYGGADGKKSVEDIVNFLLGWSSWLAEIINTIKNFFSELMGGN